MAGPPLFAYVGCFTTVARGARGDGINVYRVDRQSGAWTHVQRVGELVNPSFLILDRGERVLYVVHADLAEVSAFTRDPATGMLAFLNRQPTGGRNPVHLALDPSGRWLAIANYAGGNVALLSIRPDGALGPIVDSVALAGEPGPHRTEQPGPHPHHAPFDPSGRFVVVPDKGLDRVFVFRLDAAAGRLAANEPASVKTRAGAGPRHIAFHPAVPVAYVVNELDSTVATYRWDSVAGTLEPLQILPTVPPAYTGDNTGSEIAVAPSGNAVYVSNRGHDSIAAFAVERPSGLLAPHGWEATQGRKPRFFALDPTGRVLHAANEGSDTITAFRLDSASGRLEPTGQVVATASPACIAFAGTAV
jgi:6-phosphogluconolactonase (cycloisomerase 2 family)